MPVYIEYGMAAAARAQPGAAAARNQEQNTSFGHGSSDLIADHGAGNIEFWLNASPGGLE